MATEDFRDATQPPDATPLTALQDAPAVFSLGQAGCPYTSAEIDPRVFGEELERPVDRQTDRTAAVGLVAVKA